MYELIQLRLNIITKVIEAKHMGIDPILLARKVEEYILEPSGHAELLEQYARKAVTEVTRPADTVKERRRRTRYAQDESPEEHGSTPRMSGQA